MSCLAGKAIVLDTCKCYLALPATLGGSIKGAKGKVGKLYRLGVATHLNVHVSPECYAANYADGRITLG